jgi:hypothetical protein
MDPVLLKGSIQSVPAVVSLEEGAMDVVALGSDGFLQHLHFDGKDWGEWENLGITAHSAPTIQRHLSKVFIVVLNERGNLISLSRNATSTSKTWKGSLKQEELGGQLSLEFMKN